MDLVTRREWGAEPPRNRSLLTTGHLEGIAVHWTAGRGAVDHSNCRLVVWAIQDFHMRPEDKHGRGWADIAYSFLVCSHGVIFEGRGWGTRTAANGTNAANSGYHAVAYLGDAGTLFTAAGKTAIAQVIAEGQRRHPHAHRVEPHSRFTGSECPGSTIRAWVAAGGWRTSSAPIPAKEPDMLTDEYKTWFREKYVLGKDVGPPPDGDWATAQWIMRTIVLYGPHEIFLRWNDWQDSGKDPETRPNKAPANITRDAPRWWSGRSRLVGWAKDRGADVAAELQQQLMKVAGLQAQVDALIVELDEARVAHGDQSETVKELRRRLKAVVPLLEEALSEIGEDIG